LIGSGEKREIAYKKTENCTKAELLMKEMFDELFKPLKMSL